MTTAVTLAAPAAPSAAEATPHAIDYAGMAEEICNNAVCVQLWDNPELTTDTFRYDARRSDSKGALAAKYRSEIEYYLPHFTKVHGPQSAHDLSSLARFIKECAACYSYLYALDCKNHTALSFDNETDKVWAKRMELEEVKQRIEELQDELDEAENEERRLTRFLEAAEKAELKGGQ